MDDSKTMHACTAGRRMPDPEADAQIVEATNCVFREGDDPKWAQPEFDDSGWDQAPPNLIYHWPKSRFLWERCRVDVGALRGVNPLFLQIRSRHAWRVFVEGIPAGSFGNTDTGSRTMDNIKLERVPSQLGYMPVYLVAIRFTNANSTTWFESRQLVMGAEQALQLDRFRTIEDDLAARWFSYVTSPFLFAAAIILVSLSRAEAGRREVFWFGILAGSFAFQQVVDALFHLQLPLPETIGQAGALLGDVGAITAPFLFYALRQKPVPWLFRAAFALIVPHAILSRLPAIGDATFFLYCAARIAPVLMLARMASFIVWASAATAYWPFAKLQRQDLPLFITGIVWMLAQWLQIALQLPWIGNPSFRPLAAQIQTAASLPVILVFFVMLASRFQRVQVERDDLTSEMQAARAVQRMLVPERLDPVAGFTIDTAYLPSKEVSGDFYQLLSAADGSLLVVVADVSGKGLEAGMVGAAVIGGLGDLASRQPIDVLTHLNRALKDKTRGGFVTCGCALFLADGSVEIANAGHIPPYLDGRELEVPCGPPLGIFEDAEYESATVATGSGTITFVSDGVVEAENAQRELFGFDRTRDISSKPTQEIADAAKAWGQNDDITVVTVRRNS